MTDKTATPQAARLQRDAGDVLILDGGTGTELERRGVPMDPQAWCGRASLGNADTLTAIHLDYINAGARLITANTYASSRLMLAAAGAADDFEEINRTAIEAAHRARRESGRDDVLVAGSLSHMCPMQGGTADPDLAREPSGEMMAAAFGELANLLRDAGCDLILLEMMYYPQRMPHALAAACATGLPVWAGLSARRGKDGRVLSFAPDRELPLAELLPLVKEHDIAAAGIMHTPSDVVGEALEIIGESFDGPLYAYPDSGFFRMPSWQFEDVIPPEDFLAFARQWARQGARAIGGCCGLSPEHIAVLQEL